MTVTVRTLANARALLLAARNGQGYWNGELSSSALSTATALCALALARREGGTGGNHSHLDALILGSRLWLVQHQNEDGGWGDTVESPTNISTTTICWAALSTTMEAPGDPAPIDRAAAWLRAEMGELTPEAIAETICKRYGLDRTFSIPILTLCALAGCFGEGPAAWRGIPALPFELGALPRRWFNRLGLPVVSYALPALIAVGNVLHHQNPSRNPIIRLVRSCARGRTLRVLEDIQPASGGFLEAAPLTSFVAMSLIGSGLAGHVVTEKCLAFLADTVRKDGSWPIDTNLCTWVTTLAVKALARVHASDEYLTAQDRDALRTWLVAQQGQTAHPYTLAAAGGWAWTNLSGGVPDGDDTPGALLALHLLAEKDAGGVVTDRALVSRAALGVQWLWGLQNKDGGIPTFCRGWGKLPFDKSCPDLTAHALRAWFAWRPELEQALQDRVDRRSVRAITFLLGTQANNGSWTPLWFGNQAVPDQANPLYGTAVTLGIPELPDAPAFDSLRAAWAAARTRAVAWLLAAQGDDGGWGGAEGVPPSIEETALAVDALARGVSSAVGDDRRVAGIRRGCDWLVAATREGTHFPPAPIGLYFAKLWYHEQLYPLIFTNSALAAALPCLGQGDTIQLTS